MAAPSLTVLRSDHAASTPSFTRALLYTDLVITMRILANNLW
jgi:hypothetical protein